MRHVTTASPIDLTTAPSRAETPDLGELADVDAALRAPSRLRPGRVGVRPLRLRPRARSVVPGLRADRHRLQDGARREGRVPRHPVPLRRDALVRGAGQGALRTAPRRDPARACARRPLAQRPGRVLPCPQGRADAARAGRQGRVDERTAPRREHGPRRDSPRDLRRLAGLVKINPIASWSDADVAGYVRDHDLPVHPLSERGYESIGCWPCTRPVAEGEDARAGRWAGSDKTECGLHH